MTYRAMPFDGRICSLQPPEITIRPARLCEMRDRGGALFAAAAAETGSQGQVQWQFLENLEAMRALLLLAVEADGQLVGYCCASVGPEYWSDEIVCTTLSIFVEPKHRGRAGLPLLRALDAARRAMGASGLRVMAIPKSRLERLCRRLGLVARSIALESSDMQYTAAHDASRHRYHVHRSSGLLDLRRRTPGERGAGELATSRAGATEGGSRRDFGRPAGS